MIPGTMGTALAQVVFLNPWVLAGLAALPLLWFLLRVTPPAPRRVVLPSARFLAGLIPENQTASRTPWWILLLRLLIAALVIVALARPVLDPASALPESGAVRLVIDNGWDAAQTWAVQMRTAREIAARAGHENRPVYGVLTAPAAGDESSVSSVSSFGPVSGAEAIGILRGLAPVPWPADHERVAAWVRESRLKGATLSVWLSTGVRDAGSSQGVRRLISTLQAQGRAMIFTPETHALPVLLAPARRQSGENAFLVLGAAPLPAGLPLQAHALDARGRVIDRVFVSPEMKETQDPARFSFSPMHASGDSLARVELAERDGAGAVWLLDSRAAHRRVGIVAPAGRAASAPLIEAAHYLTRALEPYADVRSGQVAELLDETGSPPDLIILPDIASMPLSDINALESWVMQGGVLVRFAGEHMAAARDSFLLPVPLRQGGRVLDGGLGWENPLKIGAFSTHSPLHGLPVPHDVTVRRQILPERVQDLSQKTWATLEDGTPLVTAEGRESGLIVLIHTTATPEWSDLALSGTYVAILRRLSTLAGHFQGGSADTGRAATDRATPPEEATLSPVFVLDGFGRAVSAGPYVQPVPVSALERGDVRISPRHPPGLYARPGYDVALNIGSDIRGLGRVDEDVPASADLRRYEKTHERELSPAILAVALGLLLVDWLVMIFLVGGVLFMRFPKARAGTVRRFCIALFLGCAGFSLLAGGVITPARAQEKPLSENMLAHGADFHLAYVRSGIPAMDTLTHKGLSHLATTIAARTAIVPAGVVAVNPATDPLSLFPVIYWPLVAGQIKPSDSALRNLQAYLDQGGTIVFDTRDGNQRASEETLRRIVGTLNIPALEPISEDHVLTRSYYLLSDFGGAREGATLWVAVRSGAAEGSALRGRDGVSPVIIGGHDWAAAWALAAEGGGDSRRQEISLRFGVNLVMYALTGNYKADQLHIPHILERLGQ